MSDAGKAVFLSYASQDAEAVQRIADALRATGVEVWFDRNELVGGDAWDQKIRGQIASCAFFVPVISAATQARGEGYFRLEWKLAVDRSHLMAHDQPFLLPVVIDGTTDAAARVPPEFRAVQWTRLPGAGVSPEVLARWVNLWSHRAGLVKHEARPPAAGVSPAEPARPEATKKKTGAVPSVLWGGAAIAAGLGLAGYFWAPRVPEDRARPGKTADAAPGLDGNDPGRAPLAALGRVEARDRADRRTGGHDGGFPSRGGNRHARGGPGADRFGNGDGDGARAQRVCDAKFRFQRRAHRDREEGW